MIGRLRQLIIVGVLFGITELFAGISVEVNPREPRVGGEFTLNILFQNVPNAKKGSIDFKQSDITILNRKWEDKSQRDFFGRVSKFTVYSFTLKAKSSGIKTIKNFTWTVNNNPMHIEANLRINVKRGYRAQGLSIYPILSKKSLYIGEQFRYTINMGFYDNYQGNLAFSKEDFGTDFWAHKNKELKLEKKRAKAPYVDEAVLKYAYLSPTKSGKISLPTIEMSYTKEGQVKREEKKEKRGNSSFFFSSTQSKSIDAIAKTPQIEIDVKPLPTAGKPDSFSGLVGQYTFSSAFDKKEIEMGDAITLTMKMSGNGRPGAIPNPKLPDFSQFRTVPPEVNTSKRVVGGLIRTTKTAKYFLYPKLPGTFELEPIVFNYFDPKAGTYKSRSSGPITITVKKGTVVAGSVAGQQLLVQSQDRIRSLGSDIRFIKKEIELLQNDGASIHAQVWYWILLCTTTLPLFLVLIFKKMRGSAGLSSDKRRRGKARSQALKRLKEAQSALNSNDIPLFYTELNNAVTKYLSDKLSVEFIGLTIESAIVALTEKKVSDEQIGQYRSLMSQCDKAQFAALQISTTDMQSDFDTAETLLKSLEKKV
ncbi:MAG: BatD family protein [Fibrobacterales bacterium]